MAAAVGGTLLQAAVGAPPAALARALPGGPALPVAAAAPGAQGEAEGRVEAQQVVVGIAEEVQQHLQARDGHGSRDSGDWTGRVGCCCPHPTLGVPTSFLGLSPPFFVLVSFRQSDAKSLLRSLCPSPSFVSFCVSTPPPTPPNSTWTSSQSPTVYPRTAWPPNSPAPPHSPAPPTLPEEASMGGGRVLPLRLASRGPRGESPSYTNR